jgi:hypothetical protein
VAGSCEYGDEPVGSAATGPGKPSRTGRLLLHSFHTGEGFTICAIISFLRSRNIRNYSCHYPFLSSDLIKSPLHISFSV